MHMSIGARGSQMLWVPRARVLQVVINFLIQVLGIKCGPSAIVVFALYCTKSSGNLLQAFWVLFLIESETDPRTLRHAK